MAQQKPAALMVESAEWLGSIQPLIDQIGSPAVFASLAEGPAARSQHGIRTLSELKSCLEDYLRRILQPLELPAIKQAFNHAHRNELRELLAFDETYGRESAWQPLAAASRRAGQNQLQRLRPMRDQRLVQRYLSAVEHGDATGWHTLVYGVTLAVYSVPLRQGLFGYAQQTTFGFIQSAARDLALSETDCGSLFSELTLALPAAVDGLLTSSVS